MRWSITSAAWGWTAWPVTDHGNLHAAWSFYEAAKAAKIRPILGFEAYLAFGSRRQREKPSGAPAFYSHLVLLAQNRTGYKNLIKLSSIGYTEGFYRRPRIDKEVLEAHSEGIVCLAACLSGEVALYLRQGTTRKPAGARPGSPGPSGPTASGSRSNLRGQLLGQLRRVAQRHRALDERGPSSFWISSASFLPTAFRSTSASARREAGEDVGDPHHLLLVGDDAVGRLEDVLAATGAGSVTASWPSFRRMKTRCIPASSGPGRSSAFEATRSSNRSHFMARSVSVASADSNWKTPAVRPCRSSS